MSELENFTRYWDNPSLDRAGLSPVATSVEQLENMTLEERQKVVVSVEVLTKYSGKLTEEIKKIASNSEDIGKLKETLEDSLNKRIDEVVSKISQSDLSLNISNLWFGIQSNTPEIRWEKPNWNKPYQVEVYLSKNSSTNLSTATLSSTVESPKDYHVFTDDVEGKYVFVRAKDKESGTYGEFSPILKIEDKDVRLAKFLEYVQGKIKATALDEKLLSSLKESINSATDSKVSSEIAKVTAVIEFSKNQINNTIDTVRTNSESAWSQLRDTVTRNGTDISSIKRKSEGLAESIDTLTAKSNTALAGIENINTVIAEKDSAVRREIQNAITQVDSTRTELRRELSQSATAFESKLSEERDARTQVGNSLAKATEKLDQIATESEALKKRTSSIETDVAGNKTKTLSLEKNLSSLESSTIEQLDSIRSSFNNDHFYNHNMSGGESSWMTDNPNQDLSVSVNTGTSSEDLRYPNILSSIVNTGNIFVKSTEARPIEKDKTYQLTATFRTTDTTANLKEAILYLLPFDKSGNNHTPNDGLLNRQGGSRYPIIQAKQEVRPNGWVTLTGEIHDWSSSYPISDPSQANLIPLPTVFGCPALELIGKAGAGSFKADIVVLDLRDISNEKSVTALIDGYKKTQSDENKALAQQFSSQTASFKEGIDSRITTLSNSISEASRTANTRLEDITSKLGESNSKIQKLEQTVNDEKSSNALKIDTLRAEFQKSKANQINFDLDQTPTFEAQPVTKYRIIDTSAAFLIKREYVQKFPEKKYLKFWGRTLEFKNSNRLPVKSNDRLYSSANLFSTRANIQGFIRYTDENGNQIGALQSVGTISKNTVATLENSNLIVPENPAIKFAELRFDTGSNSLSETDDPILISNPQLRHYDETAIKSDSKINDLKIAVSSELQSYSERTQGVEAELNGRLAQNNIKQTARAEADEVATSKVETAKSELQNSISNIETAQTTLSNKVKAQAEEIKTVKSGFDSEISKANSRIDSTTKTLNDKYSSLASKTDTLESNYRSLDGKQTEAISKINELKKTTNDKYQSLAEKTTSLESNFNTVDGKISNAINSERVNTEATANRAAAEVERTLSAKLGEAEGKITEAKNIAVDAQGKVNGKIGLKIESGPDGAKRVVGWESTDNGEVGTFAISADNFYLNNPSIPGYRPFSVENGRIRFNGLVSFSNTTGTPPIPTQADIQDTANSAVNNAKSTIINDAKTQVKSELASSIADAKKAGTDAQSLATQAKNNADSANTKATQAQNQAQEASTTATTANNSVNSLSIKDTRNDNQPPSWYRDRTRFPLGTSKEFKKRTAIGLNVENGEFVTLETEARWGDRTGGAVTQTAKFDNGSIYVRYSTNETTWSAWLKANPTVEEYRGIVRTTTEIDGGNLSTGTISVDKLNFSPSAVNLFVNSQLMPLNPDTQDGSPLFWSFHDHASRSRDLTRCQNLGQSEWSGGVDGRVERVYTNNSGPNEFAGGSWRHLIAQDVWLTPGTYIFSFYSANHGSNPTRLLNSNFEGNGSKIIPRFERLDSNRSFVPSANPNANGISVVSKGVIPSGNGLFQYGYINADRGWIKCNVTVSTWYRIGVGVSSSSNSERSELWFGRPMLELVPSTQNSPSPFSHSVTRVDKDSLYVPKLSALSANMGDITAGSININNRAKISTDGTLTATGANINGTITATGGSITGDLYVGDRNGGYVLISGSQKAIIVYEGTVPKVRLGKLN